MHPSRAKAMQAEAQAETARSVADLVAAVARVEAKLDQVLAAPPPPSSPAAPTKPAKDK